MGIMLCRLPFYPTIFLSTPKTYKWGRKIKNVVERHWYSMSFLLKWGRKERDDYERD